MSAPDVGMTPRPRRLRWAVALGIVLFALVASALALLLVLPRVVRARAIAAAHAMGVELRIEGVSLGMTDVTLTGLALEVPSVPALHATAEAVSISLQGLTPDAATARGLDVRIDGDAMKMAEDVERWRAAHAPVSRGARPILSSLRAERAHLVARLGAGRVEGSDVDLELRPGPSGLLGEAHRIAIARALVTFDKLAFGPWGISSDSATKRLEVMLDPDGAKHARVTVTSFGDPAAAIEIAIPRSRLAALHVPIASDLELAVHATARPTVPSAPRTMQLAVNGEAFGVRIRPEMAPMDAQAEFAVEGDMGAPLSLQRGRFKAGPFAGALRGTIAWPLKVDLTYQTDPLPCAQFAKMFAVNALGTLGGQLADLAQAAGLTKAVVAGHVAAHGAITFDAATLAAPSVTFVPTQQCGLALPRRSQP